MQFPWRFAIRLIPGLAPVFWAWSSPSRLRKVMPVDATSQIAQSSSGGTNVNEEMDASLPTSITLTPVAARF